MACMQQDRIPAEHETAISQMKAVLANKKTNKGHHMLLKAGGGNLNAAPAGTQTSVVYTEGLIENKSPGDQIEFQEGNNWSGNVLGDYPPSILKRERGGFTHKAKTPLDYNGSKGAVVYKGKSNGQVGDYDIAWLLSWHVPMDGTKNKVYVECGPIDKYKTITWTTIEANLNKSDKKMYSMDPTTGARVTAAIESPGTEPELAVVFDVKV